MKKEELHLRLYFDMNGTNFVDTSLKRDLRVVDSGIMSHTGGRQRVEAGVSKTRKHKMLSGPFSPGLISQPLPDVNSIVWTRIAFHSSFTSCSFCILF